MDYQDVLAEIGATNAHPGGSVATESWRAAIPWHTDMRILDVGCGTGKTLIDICSTVGCKGTGVDIRPKMVDKATERARLRERRNVDFLAASATALPFSDNTFDLVYSESVNVFLSNPGDAIAECARVLRQGALYIDVEMLIVQPVDERWRASVLQVYGAKTVPDQRGWKRFYQSAGFRDIRVLTTKSVDPFDVSAHSADDTDLASPGAYERDEVIATLRANGQWMEGQHRPLGYGVFLCVK